MFSYNSWMNELNDLKILNCFNLNLFIPYAKISSIHILLKYSIIINVSGSNDVNSTVRKKLQGFSFKRAGWPWSF